MIPTINRTSKLQPQWLLLARAASTQLAQAINPQQLASLLSRQIRPIHHLRMLHKSVFHELGGTGTAPWEVGHPQPAVVRLAAQGAFTGDILDVGCGDCNNAIHIAQATGRKITAFDLVPRAVQHARHLITQAGANVHVFQADAFHLHASPISHQQFDTVLDAAVFHFFNDPKRLLYRDILYKLVRPGGLFVLLVLSEKCTAEFPGGRPRKVTRGEIEELFTGERGWKVEGVKEAVYQLVVGDGGEREDMPAYVARVRKVTDSRL